MEAGQAPIGTIALLFTDIEGSTRSARLLGAGWPPILAQHHVILTRAIEAQGGFIDGGQGDSFFATFADAGAAARAAVRAQRDLRAHAWPAEIGELKVRMGLHVGYVERGETGYVGLEVHRAARVSAAAHGGQILITRPARELLAGDVASESLGSHRLKDFPEAEPLYCLLVDGRGANAFPPPRTQQVRPTNLPAGVPVLVGREGDETRIRDALLRGGERLVTLTGRSGVGKTSLAHVVSAGLLDEHPGGVWVTRLAALERPEDVIPAVASAIGADGEAGTAPHDAVLARLEGRGATLLVLDNMEHLLAAGAEIGRLLDALPDVRVLVTSQAPLRIAPELCLPVDPLDGDAALALIERVAARRSAPVPADGAEREALRAITQLLDGLPLALELAAARLTVLTPTQLMRRLSSVDDVLRDDRSDRAARHRSLRATVDWSLGLLAPPARELFVRLGVFARPAELEAIEAVTDGDGVDAVLELAALRDVALVRRSESGDGHVRFGLPQALRSIAAELLDGSADGERWRRAHAQHACDVAWAARSVYVSRAEWDAAVAADAEIAAALRWARSANDPLAVPLAAAYSAVLFENGQIGQAAMVIEPLLAQPPVDPLMYAQALWCQSRVASGMNDGDEVVRRATQAYETAPDQLTRTLALGQRGIGHWIRGDHSASVADSERATEIARELGPECLCAALLHEAQARAYTDASGRERAAELIAEAERIGEAIDTHFLWRSHTIQGGLSAQRGDPSGALRCFLRSLEECELRGHDSQAAYDIVDVGHALAALGCDEAAVEVVAIGVRALFDIFGTAATSDDLLHRPATAAARERVGPAFAADCNRRARELPAGQRIRRVRELARAAACAHPSSDPVLSS